ncbi:hypothetical protein HPP92_020495 [Vanilla planifolia]|uniref:4-coumarate--CoA ligase n=1 Tax=Vanilla planifolia TaxID=51239 RepID=A0A835PY68_VANPL|nr:hypothetical protein HPP92_020495 [Vanilla planifolia]
MISLASPDILPHDDSPAAESAAERETFIFRSRLPDIVIPDQLPLHAYCFEKMAEVADKSCLISGSSGRTYTYAETHLLCRRAAAGLAGLGVRQGDVIFLVLQNCPEFAICFMAASFLGAATTAANPLCTPAEILKQLKSSGAKLVVTQSIYADKLGGGLTVITVDDPPLGCLSFSVLSAADEAAIPESSSNTDDAVALPFSSGTTGLPKGVVLTHRNLVSSVAQQVDGENPNFHLRKDDVVLCVLPLFHIFSLNSVLLCSLRAGAAVLIMHRFEMEAMLGLIEKHKVTVAAVVPPMVLSLVKNPLVEICNLSSIRIIISGAAPSVKSSWPPSSVCCRRPFLVRATA